MSDRAALVHLLSGVRRRLRTAAGLQGAVIGLAAFLLVTAVQLALVRWFAPELRPFRMNGWLPWLGAGIVLTAAAMAALAKVPLDRCARAVDRSMASAAGREPRNADRTLVALGLLWDGSEAPFVEAAIRDGARAAVVVSPAAAAPWRRPRGLGVVVSAATAAFAAAVWPTPTTPAATKTEHARQEGARAVLDPEEIAEQRQAVEALAKQAAELQDDVLARLAQEMTELLRALAAREARGALSQREALDRLAALQQRAAEAADLARASRRALQAAGETMATDSRTRETGEKLQSLDGEETRAALQKLGERATEMGRNERDRLAKTLERAASALAGAAEPQAGERVGRSEAQRRLSKPGQERSDDPGGERSRAPEDRQLKRLARDFEDSADRCRDDPADCRDALRNAAEDAQGVARDAQRSAAREKMAKAAEQLRERMRQQPGDRQQRLAERSFERSAEGRGTPPTGGDGTEPQAGDSRGAGQGQALPRGGDGTNTGQESSSSGGIAASESASAAGGADGVGNQSSGDPLGPRTAMSTRGELREARVKSGVGPTRAEVIESGAQRGFAETEYKPVFEAYNAAVEETLDTTAVPAGRRYLVRRYFQLIRPR